MAKTIVVWIAESDVPDIMRLERDYETIVDIEYRIVPDKEIPTKDVPQRSIGKVARGFSVG